MTVMPRQERRAGVLETPLGTDVLAIVRFDGSEGLNELFEWRMEAVSAQGGIDFDALIGKHATLTINGVNGRKRKFDGIVTQTQSLGVREHFHAYRLVLRPWLWVLAHRTDNFIFHDMPVTDIIAAVFARHGVLAEFEDRTSGPYAPIEYCVQYRESDMAFVCRLMEEFGISYSFAHADGAHKLVMSDQNSQYDTVEGGTRRYVELEGQDRRTEECLHQFIPGRRFASGKAAWKDYNFKKPTAEMLAEKEGTAAYEQAGKELYDWPGRYMELGQGQTFAQIKLEAEEAKDRRCLAAGNSPSLWAGCLMTLEDHPQSALDVEYLVLRSQHTFVSQSYRSGGGGGEDSYEGQYEMLDSAIPLRPVKVTPKPLVHGPQTAFVVGKAGEEIDCDEYGRVLVRFHWDRENDHSMRCRVAQNWAYKGWGGMIIPRIGMEVMVDFLDGDPDRPLVTGCVYNGDAMPPYALPANKTKSVFRTNTHKSKDQWQMNELTFDDKEGAEEVFVHAQKDLTVKVLNHATERIDKNKVVSVGGASLKEVQRSDTTHIGQNMTINVGTGPGGDMIRGQLAASTFGIRDAAYFLQKSMGTMTGQGNYTLNAMGGLSINAVKSASMTVGVANMVTVGGVHNLAVGGAIFESAGASSSELIGTTKMINAHSAITLRCGQSEIHMTPDGVIRMKGTKLIVEEKDHIDLKAKRIDLNK